MHGEQDSSAGGRAPRPENRLMLDYEREARRLGPPPVPIIDTHVHVNGSQAAGLFRGVCDLFGVERVLTQTLRAEAEGVRSVFGDRIRFIATPTYTSDDRSQAMRQGFYDNIDHFHDTFGSRMIKFWAAPRLRDFLDPVRDADILEFDGEYRVKLAEYAQSRGMMFMAHIADPDTWFATKYADAGAYGTKAAQYPGVERMIDRFAGPWLLAHMGGWPEDLSFLHGLLSRHDNLYLDTSATKWMIRELSTHPRAELIEFLTRWKGRILFGSDIVTSDAHFAPSETNVYGSGLAASEAQAFDLYASRYWALRTMWETDYEGESPIADPDLAMVDPARCDEMSAPRLVGRSLREDLLVSLYHGAAEGLYERAGIW